MFIKTKKIIVILFQKIANGNQTKDKFYLISYNLNERKYKLLRNEHKNFFENDKNTEYFILSIFVIMNFYLV